MLGFTKIVEFNQKIEVQEKVVCRILGEFNIENGRLSLYIEDCEKELIEKNKEEVQKQINDFMQELKNEMQKDGLPYYI